MIASLYAITRNAFCEITRQPVYGILLLSGMALIGVSPAICAFTMMEDVKLVIDMGLGTIFMLGLVMAVLSATTIISREIEAKTAGAVMSKPVGRVVFVVGKFFGVSLAMALAAFLLTAMLLMTVRMGVPTNAGWKWDWPVFLAEFLPAAFAMGFALYANYFYRWNFASTAVTLAFPFYVVGLIFACVVNRDWGLDSGEYLWIANSLMESSADQVLLAAILVFLGVWVISAIAVAASTRLNVVANVLLCLCVFFVGMVSHFLFGWTIDHSWLTWMPEQADKTVRISGRVGDADGKALAGVRMNGLPGRPLTNSQGHYAAVVRREGTGAVKPYKNGYVFSPAERGIGNIASDESGQDFVAFERYEGLTLYAHSAWSRVAWVTYHAAPSFQLFWVADQLTRPDPYIPKSYVGTATAYAALWCAAMVALAAFLFERREIV